MASTRRGTTGRIGGNATAFALATALALALGVVPLGPARTPGAGAEPHVLGRTETKVPILRGHGAPAESAAATAQAAEAARGAARDSAGNAGNLGAGDMIADPEALALTRRFVTAFGGPVALRAWVERGERHGRQSIYLPAQISLHYVERRTDGRARVDAKNGGVEVSFAEGPADSWQ